MHTNRYVPADGNVKEKLGPPGDTRPESYSPSPLSSVAVWVRCPVKSHTTVPPRATVTRDGKK